VIARLRPFGNVIGLTLAWALMFFGFGLAQGGSFLSFDSFELILRQSTIVGLAAVGMTFVIMTAGIDLSVGSMVALVSVVIAYVLKAGHDPLVALGAGLAAGVLCGALNGVLVTKLKVTPFIVTLGTFLALRGAAKGLANEQKIDPPSVTWISDMLRKVPDERAWMLLPPGVWMLVLLAVAAMVWLRYTRHGRHIQAVGSNEMAARLCGIPVDRTKIAVYAFMGLCAGLSGAATFGRLAVGDPSTAQGLELQVIAAVVIGGASLMGGTGSIAGTLIGALMMSTIASGSVALGWPNWVQEIVTGAIIVAAVALDRVRHRRAA
jgi:ribose/xylose/arabinose/galactoside ABC-type transport system permease subunit